MLEVIDNELDPVPAAGARLPTVRHGAPGRAGGSAKEQPKIISGNIGKCRPSLREESEAQMSRVEGDCGIDVVDHVGNVDPCHRRYFERSRQMPVVRATTAPGG